MHARVALVIPALLAIFWLSSCASPPDVEHGDPDRGHHARDEPRGPRRAPELARFESRPLKPLQRGSLAGSADRSLDVPEMPMAAPGARRIHLKLLVITATGSEPAYLAARSALDRIGAPHDVLIATTTDLAPAMLSNGADACYYRGIVIAEAGLGYFDPGMQTWTSAFTADEWATLASYEAACSARELIWYGWPSADLGLALSSSFDSTDEVTARITPGGAGLFPHVPGSAAIPIRDAFGYRATVADPASTTALVQSDDGSALAARHVGPDGRETVIVTVDSNPNLVHGLVLEYGLVGWVSRGLFIGKKRAYLTPQVDDIFIDDDLWNTATHRNDPDLDGVTTFRLAGSDLAQLVSWQAGLRARLPAGSRYLTTMAFNGVGAVSPEFPDPSLLAAALAAGDELAWVNHTWDHDNMDQMTSAAAQDEVAWNCELAEHYHLNGFSCSELVTPDMSGLTNPEAMRGIVDAGARYVVSDTSITGEIAAERGTTPGNNPSFNVGRVNSADPRVYGVPRHPTNIFYDVTTRAAEVDEYNTIYRDHWRRDLSYDEIIDIESSFGLHYLLAGDIDPLMFHQPNLKSEIVDGAPHSLFGDWLEASATRFAALCSFPILTLPLQDIARAMQERGELDACGAAATYVEGGSSAAIELRSTGTCTVPFTGMASAAGTVEVYAGVPTTRIAIQPGETKLIALP